MEGKNIIIPHEKSKFLRLDNRVDQLEEEIEKIKEEILILHIRKEETRPANQGKKEHPNEEKKENDKNEEKENEKGKKEIKDKKDQKK